MRLGGHLWTLWPVLRRRFGIPPPPPEEPWGMNVEDLNVGTVALTGRLSVPEGATQLVLLVHGLGGCIDSVYMIGAARQAHALGMATLRLNMRGADRAGGDIHHAGLSSDLEQVLADPALRHFDDLFVWGFSLGGHLALRYGIHVDNPRVRALAAVCSPLHLAATVRDFDRPVNLPYRRYILAGLSDMYQALAGLPAFPTPHEEIRKIRTVQEFDRLTVVPRFGFESPADYYEKVNVARHLQQLRRPSLLVLAEDDPMVSARSVREGLAQAPENLEVHWARRGGHVSFPADLDLGQGGQLGLESQVLSWFKADLESSKNGQESG